MDVLEKTKKDGTDNYDGPEIDHLYCCDKNVALCGTDISDAYDIGADIHDSSEKCVVCQDLIDAICPKCGQ